MESKEKQALKDILSIFGDEHIGLDEFVKETENWKIIENAIDRLEKYDTLHNTIKHKLACAQRDLEIEKNSLTMSLIKLEQLKGQIAAYNDILSLMESLR